MKYTVIEMKNALAEFISLVDLAVKIISELAAQQN